MTASAPPVGLRKAAQRGARAGLLVSFASQALSLLVTMALARLLTPNDFGLVAAATIVVGATVLLTQFGLNTVLVQRERIDRTVSSTIFWSSLLLGAAAAGTAAALARPLAGLVGLPTAAPLIVALTPVVLLRLLAGVPRALLQRQLLLARVYLVEGSALLVTAVTQVSLAVAGFGAWSMIGGQAAGAAVLLPALLVAARWRPSRCFSLGVLRSDARFSGGMLTTTLFAYLGKNVDYWVVAHVLGARALGIYYMAYVLPTILRQRVTWIGKDVLVPVFARLRGDVERTRRAYLETLRLHALVGLPTMVGLALTADDVIAVFFGSQWADAAAPLSILALAALFEFLKQPATTVFVAHGKPGRVAVVEAVRLCVMVAGLAGAAARGGTLMSFSLAVLGASAASAAAAHVLVRAHVDVDAPQVARSLWPVAVPTASMALAVLTAQVVTSVPDGAVALLLLVPLGAATFAVVALAAFPRATVESAREGAALLGLRRRGPAATGSGGGG